jgi:uncharacterized membrane protein HdeD (DUF308 family)
MQRQFDIFIDEAPDILAVHWGWPIALGLGLVALGIIAIWRARAATTIFVRFLGALVLVSAASVLLFAFSLTGYWIAFVAHVLWAILVAIVGLILLFRPNTSAEAITLMIAFYFIASGLLTIGFSLFAHVDGAWLYAMEGLVSAALGILVLAGWPFSGTWVIGTFIGINLLFKGSAIIALGLSLRAISEG